MGWSRKDLLSMQELDASEITLLVDTAASLQEIASRDIKKVPALRGKTIVNLFYEASTRTRTSFEIAGKWLSADVINFSASGSSTTKGSARRRGTSTAFTWRSWATSRTAASRAPTSTACASSA